MMNKTEFLLCKSEKILSPNELIEKNRNSNFCNVYRFIVPDEISIVNSFFTYNDTINELKTNKEILQNSNNSYFIAIEREFRDADLSSVIKNVWIYQNEDDKMTFFHKCTSDELSFLSKI